MIGGIYEGLPGSTNVPVERRSNDIDVVALFSFPCIWYESE